MSESLRAFIIVIFIAVFMGVITKSAFKNIVLSKDFTRRISIWFMMTALLFLSNSFWIYIVGSAIIIQFAKPYEKNFVAMYFMLLFVAPMYVSVDLFGFGIMNYMFTLTPVRLLELVILFPAALTLSRQSDTISFGRTFPDKILLSFFVLIIVLQFRERTFTDVLRFLFYLYIDAFLPYYVCSRALKNTEQFRDAMGALVISSLILAGISVFEYAKFWMLYSGITGSMGIPTSWGGYLLRGGSVRSMASVGQPIALGFVLMIAIGFFLYLRQLIPKHLIRFLILGILAGGLYATVSRGPWVGMVVFLIINSLLGYKSLSGMAKLLMVAGIAFFLLSVLPGGEKILNLLPFISSAGSEQGGTVSYRQDLIDMGLIVIHQHLWFGSISFLDTPEMQSLMGGQGIIDLVNSYLSIALNYGLVGLVLFSGFFISILYGVYRSFRLIKFKENHESEYLLGVTLFALLVAILVTIFTVSSVLSIPVMYWAVAGMAVGYIQMIQQKLV